MQASGRTVPVVIPRFRLDVFEGPLDLLLHLIKKSEVDIYDIPIATITEQYLAVLEFLDQLNLDLAGEYLVMASTLMYIKSRMMLPAEEGDDEEAEDPRAELVQQLEEYKRFREMAAELAGRDLLDRDVFRRNPSPLEGAEAQPPPLREVSIADLLDALREVIARLPADRAQEILGERISIADRIPLILERLRAGEVEFGSLLSSEATRREIVATFLALLELVRVRVVRAAQSERFGPILLSLSVPGDVAFAIRDEYEQ